MYVRVSSKTGEALIGATYFVCSFESFANASEIDLHLLRRKLPKTCTGDQFVEKVCKSFHDPKDWKKLQVEHIREHFLTVSD